MSLQLHPLARKFLPVVLAGGMVAAALSGCGGSGAGSSTLAPVPPTPVPTQTHNLGIHEFAGAVGAQSAMTGLVDGTGAQARFSSPGYLAPDQAGNVFVVDRGNGVLRKVTAAGVVTTLARPAGTTVAVAAGASGNLYLLDGASGVKLITSAGAETALLLPDATVSSIATDRQGNLYASAYAWRWQDDKPCASMGPKTCVRIYKGTLHKLTPGGVWVTVATFDNLYLGSSGASWPDSLAFAGGVAVDAAGTVYASDPLNNRIVKVTADGVATTLAGTPGTFGVANGAGAAARFNKPTDLAVDAAGNVYVNDSNNCLIRKITPAGVVTIVAGTVGRAELVTGSLPGSLSFVSGMAIDANGDLVLSVQNGLVKIALP